MPSFYIKLQNEIENRFSFTKSVSPKAFLSRAHAHFPVVEVARIMKAKRQDMSAASSPREAKARAQMSRFNSRQLGAQTSLQKEAELEHSKEDLRLQKETQDLIDTLATLRREKVKQSPLKGPLPPSDLNSGDRRPIVVPRVVMEDTGGGVSEGGGGDEYEEEKLPRRLRPTLQADLQKAIRKGAEARWERIQKEKLNKLGLSASPDFADFARTALTPPPPRFRRKSSPEMTKSLSTTSVTAEERRASMKNRSPSAIPLFSHEKWDRETKEGRLKKRQANGGLHLPDISRKK